MKLRPLPAEEKPRSGSSAPGLAILFPDALVAVAGIWRATVEAREDVLGRVSDSLSPQEGPEEKQRYDLNNQRDEHKAA